jgi:hypothetical protein
MGCMSSRPADVDQHVDQPQAGLGRPKSFSSVPLVLASAKSNNTAELNNIGDIDIQERLGKMQSPGTCFGGSRRYSTVKVDGIECEPTAVLKMRCCR